MNHAEQSLRSFERLIAGAELDEADLGDVDEAAQADILLSFKAFERVVSPM